jgi:serpin B
VARGTAEADPDIGQTARALRIANGLWGEQTYPFSEAFSAQLEQSYGAGLQATDFVNAPEAARQEINAWVAEQTEDRIRDIVPEGAIDRFTRLVLANAIYFYGGWESWFAPEATEDDAFHLLDGTTATVPFMVQHDHLDYARGDGFQAVELPYLGSGFAFTVVLPDDGRFAAVEAGLDVDALSAAIGQLASTDVRVYLPRFEFAFGPIELAQTLKAMGMTDAVDPKQADFAGMAEGTPPDPLFIGNVLHKAFISVDEQGTEAAAATVVIGLTMATPPDGEPPEPLEVRVDRPFLFAIRDRVTGTLLFLGRVMDPTA